MATTPNYGWVTPDNTSFVKDGALAIRNVSNSIDATSAGANFAGLVLVKTQTIGAAVSTVTVSSAFSATYDAYLVLIDVLATSAVGQNGIQLLSGATPAITNYNSAGPSHTSAGVAGGNGNEGTIQLRWASRGQNGVTLAINVVNPFLAARTKFFGSNLNVGSGTPIVTSSAMAGVHTDSTSYDAIRYIALDNAGATGPTLTGGTITVYGYRKAI